MSDPLEGEIVAHQNRPFYAQQKAPKLFWGGCLLPILVVVVVGFFVLKGLATSNGLQIVRFFILLVMLLTIAQLIFGGTIFAKTRSSLGKGLLLGALMLMLILLLGLIGAASALSSFIH